MTTELTEIQDDVEDVEGENDDVEEEQDTLYDAEIEWLLDKMGLEYDSNSVAQIKKNIMVECGEWGYVDPRMSTHERLQSDRVKNTFEWIFSFIHEVCHPYSVYNEAIANIYDQLDILPGMGVEEDTIRAALREIGIKMGYKDSTPALRREHTKRKDIYVKPRKAVKNDVGA